MKKLILLLYVCVLASCRQSDEAKQLMVFDSGKWKEVNGPDFPYRIRMVKDLMEHHDLHGVSKDSLLKDLGEPTRADKDYLFYQVKQERIGSFPLHTITLVIKLGADSLVEKVMIHK